MIKRLITKDLSNHKVIMSILFVMIMAGSFLMSSAVSIIMNLTGSMYTLFESSLVPHYVLMYSGELDQTKIDRFVSEEPMVKHQQSVELLNVSGSSLYLGSDASEAESLLENGFVTQNKEFDYLLDRHNNILEVAQGEIGVPVYYMKEKNLQAGDQVTLKDGSFEMTFTIKDFIRDAQMNPSLVNSKRLLINETDYENIKAHMGTIEYLIEFQLTDASKLSEFETTYQASELPQKGTVITYTLYQMLNALSEGMIVAVIIFISILLMGIALISLRLIIVSTLEEDYREIGIMKAIGFSNKHIQRLLQAKYLIVTGIASILGYLASLLFAKQFSTNITLFMGEAKQSIWNSILPLVGAFIVFGLIMMFCKLILRKFQKISPVEAIRIGASPSKQSFFHGVSVHKRNHLNVNAAMGLHDVTRRLPMYGFLCTIFTICIFLMIVPYSFLSTIQSPSFITYMGAGKSDLRFDLQAHTEDLQGQYEQVMKTIQSDSHIQDYSVFVTSSYEVKNQEDEWETMKIEYGDDTLFPLRYVNGHSPKTKQEITLSMLYAEELQKQIGDTITVYQQGIAYPLTVVGIYQDITNGGKTAKALLPYTEDSVLWYVINCNVTSSDDLQDLRHMYQTQFPSIKVTDMNTYVSQSLGSIISQLRLIVRASMIVSIVVAMLMCAMFLKMMMAKEQQQTSILYALGFRQKDIRRQYMVRIGCVALTSMIIGIALSMSFGTTLCGIMLSGISSLEFHVNPLIAYGVLPLLMLLGILISIYSLTLKDSQTHIRKGGY